MFVRSKVPFTEKIPEHLKHQVMNEVTTNFQTPEYQSLPTRDIPSFAWQANKLSFGSLQVPADQFKSKMQAKLDKIKDGSFKHPAIDKAEINKAKPQAILNLSGPLKIESTEIKQADLANLNKAFQHIKNIDDLYQMLANPVVPSDTPITITDMSSENYNLFMKEVKRGNDTNNVEQVVAIVDAATRDLKGETVLVPEISIKASRKELILNLIDHLKAGQEYDPFAIATSSYFHFKNDQPNEISVDLTKPVYDR
jgi:hypothetical protein